MRKHNEPSLEAERDALREEVARLNQEIRRRQMELDILKKAEEIIKKDPGISISHLNNREKTKIADALRQTYPLTELLHVLSLARSSYFYHRAALKAGDKYATIRTMLTDIFNSNYQCYGYRRLHAMLRHEGFGYQKRLCADLWWRNSLSSAVTVVAATAHIAEKSDRLRITLSPEILRRSNLIRNGCQISRSSSSLQVKSGYHRWWTASMEKL
ncbi:hypothetical protein EC2741950_4738 [Escherichia coli 2741950]|nr:hypothetical protein EC2741950_4738 [Escherichia coli 2741950]